MTEPGVVPLPGGVTPSPVPAVVAPPSSDFSKPQIPAAVNVHGVPSPDTGPYNVNPAPTVIIQAGHDGSGLPSVPVGAGSNDTGPGLPNLPSGLRHRVAGWLSRVRG
jgi:hypothetical protein